MWTFCLNLFFKDDAVGACSIRKNPRVLNALLGENEKLKANNSSSF